MNYKKIYSDIIENRKSNPLSKEVYGEVHHIIPRCLGGSDEKENLVKLSAREHFICHALLAEMYPRETFEWYKMNHAFLMMKCESSDHGGNRYFNSRLYELKRKDFSKAMSFNQTGEKNSQNGKIWICNFELKRNLKINQSELDSYLENGFVLGRTMNFELKLLKKLKKETRVKKFKDLLEFDGILISYRRLSKLSKLFRVESNSEGILSVKNTLIKLYVDEQQTTTDIAKEFKTNNETIRNWLIWFNIERRDRYKPTDWVKYKIGNSRA